MIMVSLREKECRLEMMMPVMLEHLAKGQSIRYYPRGISMLPMLRQGKDSVILSPVTGQLKKYDIPLYQRDDGHYILHRIVSVGENYTCIGDNQHEFEHGVREDQIIAVVTSFWRGEKEISTTNICYRIYCHLWHWLRPVKKILGRVKRWIYCKKK